MSQRRSSLRHRENGSELSCHKSLEPSEQTCKQMIEREKEKQNHCFLSEYIVIAVKYYGMYVVRDDLLCVGQPNERDRSSLEQHTNIGARSNATLGETPMTRLNHNFSVPIFFFISEARSTIGRNETAYARRIEYIWLIRVNDCKTQCGRVNASIVERNQWQRAHTLHRAQAKCSNASNIR